MSTAPLDMLVVAKALEQGSFEGLTHLHSDYFVPTYRPWWDWLVEYHVKHGAMPTENAFLRKFPTAGIDQLDVASEAASGLAGELINQHKQRRIAEVLTDTTSLINKGDLVGAQNLSTGLARELTAIDMVEAVVVHDALDRTGVVPDDFVIEGLLYSAQRTMLFGESHVAYKSYIAIDMAMSIVFGTPYLGELRVRPGNVFYVSTEGGRDGFVSRCEAWCEGHGADYSKAPYRLSYTSEPFNLGDALSVDQLIERAKPLKPKLIVLDILADMVGNLSLNNDMGIVMQNLKTITQQTGACVMFVHHTNRSGTGAFSGDGRLFNQADAVLRSHVLKDHEMPQLESLKQKNTAKLPPIIFEKQSVRIPDGRSNIYLDGSVSQSGAPTIVDDKADTQSRRKRVLAAIEELQAEGVKTTVRNVGERAAVSKSAVGRVVEALVAEGAIVRNGEGLEVAA